MSLSRDQRIFLLTARQRNGQPGLWHGACRSQHWNPSDREFRLAKLSEIVGRKIASTDDIERVDEFTKVKNELLILQGVSLQAGIEGSDTTVNKSSQKLFRAWNCIAKMSARFWAKSWPIKTAGGRSTARSGISPLTISTPGPRSAVMAAPARPSCSSSSGP